MSTRQRRRRAPSFRTTASARTRWMSIPMMRIATSCGQEGAGAHAAFTDRARGTSGQAAGATLQRDGLSAHCCSSVCPHSRAPDAPSPGCHEDSRSRATSTDLLMPDNGWVERVIRTLKEQCVHRQRFESLQHATRSIGDWVAFHNHRRPHQALDRKTRRRGLRICGLACADSAGSRRAPPPADLQHRRGPRFGYRARPWSALHETLSVSAVTRPDHPPGPLDRGPDRVRGVRPSQGRILDPRLQPWSRLGLGRDDAGPPPRSRRCRRKDIAFRTRRTWACRRWSFATSEDPQGSPDPLSGSGQSSPGPTASARASSTEWAAIRPATSAGRVPDKPPGGSPHKPITDGGDAIVEAGGGGTDLVRSSVGLRLGATSENLTLTGTAAINGTGNGLATRITGNCAANVLSGAPGADKLVGGLGTDRRGRVAASAQAHAVRLGA
ncbi:integrase core domain-containing protein [Cereibacter sphaeroides]|uniref:integrase core domain-containing protein n=1 Tax=Cereibacter sphaeroides TaxID=1063 RepID=UPI003990CAC7